MGLEFRSSLLQRARCWRRRRRRISAAEEPSPETCFSFSRSLPKYSCRISGSELVLLNGSGVWNPYPIKSTNPTRKDNPFWNLFSNGPLFFNIIIMSFCFDNMRNSHMPPQNNSFYLYTLYLCKKLINFF